MTENKTCSKCGETKPFDEFSDRKDSKDGKRGACKKCEYERGRKYRQEHREERKEQKRKYYQNHKKERDKKSKKYYREHREEIAIQGKKKYENGGREKAGHKSMYKDKTLPQYLGIVIGERLIRHLFNDVEVMPHGNPKFDFICNKGKKIDVKTSSTLLEGDKYPHWGFKIKRNTTADFFICVAFDNRTDLNPLHLWMIPGKEINNHSGIQISPSTIHKWDKWKRDIDNAQLCCAEIRKKKSNY